MDPPCGGEGNPEPSAPDALRSRAQQGSRGGRLTMIDLVYWSFVIALTPWALGLGWRLIAGGAS